MCTLNNNKKDVGFSSKPKASGFFKDYTIKSNIMRILLLKLRVFSLSEMKFDDFYHLVNSNFCLHLYCYIHNVSVNASHDLLQIFPLFLNEIILKLRVQSWLQVNNKEYLLLINICTLLWLTELEQSTQLD